MSLFCIFGETYVEVSTHFSSGILYICIIFTGIKNSYFTSGNQNAGASWSWTLGPANPQLNLDLSSQ